MKYEDLYKHESLLHKAIAEMVELGYSKEELIFMSREEIKSKKHGKVVTFAGVDIKIDETAPPNFLYLVPKEEIERLNFIKKYMKLLYLHQKPEGFEDIGGMV